jgi:hypothetical protein
MVEELWISTSYVLPYGGVVVVIEGGGGGQKKAKNTSYSHLE